MSKISLKLITTIGVLIAFVLIISATAIWRTYGIDDEVNSGTRYGLTIGESVIEVVRTINSEPSRSTWPVAICSAGNSHYREFAAIHLEHADLKDCNSVFLVRRRNELAINGLRLEFEDGELASIYRYRRLFELP